MIAFARLAPPIKRSELAQRVAWVYAAVLSAMVVAQLVTFERFIPIIETYWLASVTESGAVMAALLVIASVFALPYLLNMQISRLARVLCGAMPLLVGMLWCLLSFTELLYGGGLANAGYFGSIVALPFGWWSGLFGLVLVVVSLLLLQDIDLPATPRKRLRTSFYIRYLHDFDESYTQRITNWPRELELFMRAIGHMGAPLVVIPFGVLVTLLAWNGGLPSVVIAFALGFVGYGLSWALKSFLHRTRPDTLYVTNMKFKSFSFPSGHSYGAAAFYGWLVYFALGYIVWPLGIALAAITVSVIIGIGISRVYLGAHFPTDVLGGWLLGGLSVVVIAAFVGV